MNTLKLAEAKSFLLKEIGNNPYRFSIDPSVDGAPGPTYVFSTETKTKDISIEKEDLSVGNNLHVKPDKSSIVDGAFGIKRYYIGDVQIFMFDDVSSLRLSIIKRAGNEIKVEDRKNRGVEYILNIDEVNKKINSGEITIRKNKSSTPTRYFVTIDNTNKIEDPFPEIENVATYKGDEKDMLRTLDVSFGAGPTIDNTDTSGLTRKDDALRVMATVMAIIRLEFRKHSRTQILMFSPSPVYNKDRDEQDSEEGTTNTRGRVYLGYIKSEFRDGISKGLVKIKIDGDEYIIKFDRDYLDKYLSSKS